MDIVNISSLKTGDVVLFHTALKWYSPLTWLSALIRFFAKTPYNHVGVVVFNWGVPFINEAVESGLRPTLLSYRLKGKRIRIIRESDKEINERVFAVKANSVLGVVKYDFASLFFFQLIFQLFHVWLGRTKEKAEKRMYCYEYFAWLYDYLYPKWWQINPKDILTDSRFVIIYETEGAVKKQFLQTAINL